MGAAILKLDRDRKHVNKREQKIIPEHNAIMNDIQPYQLEAEGTLQKKKMIQNSSDINAQEKL